MATSRRAFLKTASATAAGAFLAPRILGMAPKHGLSNPVVGSGDHQYECIHDWAQVPSDIAFGNTHGVAQDAQGLIYIKHTVHTTSSKADAICVFDPDGKFVRSWGAEYKGGAHGLHLSKEAGGEFLYLCDQARGVVDKTTLKGEKAWSKTAPLESGVYNGQNEYHATNIAVVPMGFPRAGDFFIGDGYGKAWIHRYNAKGDYLGSFGGLGKERGQLNCPHGLMVDTRPWKTPKGEVSKEPRLVVADRANRRLQYFDLDGHSQGFVTDELRLPCHFHERNGELLIPDLEARVTLFDKDNKLIVHLGDGTNSALRDKPREQFIPGKFIAPHSAIFDRDGNIFVVEWVEVGRVTKLRRVS
jgi:hypothetical protein